MRVLIVGGTGMIDQPLVRALLARADTVVVFGPSEARIAERFGTAWNACSAQIS